MADSSKRREEKRKQTLQATPKRFYWLTFVCSAVILFVLYWISPWSEISSFQVQGNVDLSEETIQTASPLSQGQKVLKVLPEFPSIERQFLELYPQIKTMDVSVGGWNQIVYTVEEYPILAYVEEEDWLYPVIETGQLVDNPRKISQGNHLEISGFEEEGEENFQELVEELVALDEDIRREISEIQYKPSQENPHRLHLYMNDGNEVWVSIGNFSNQMQYYPSMVRSIDGMQGIFYLEAGAYFKSFEAAEEEATQVDEAKRPGQEGETDESSQDSLDPANNSSEG